MTTCSEAAGDGRFPFVSRKCRNTSKVELCVSTLCVCVCVCEYVSRRRQRGEGGEWIKISFLDTRFTLFPGVAQALVCSFSPSLGKPAPPRDPSEGSPGHTATKHLDSLRLAHLPSPPLNAPTISSCAIISRTTSSSRSDGNIFKT